MFVKNKKAVRIFNIRTAVYLYKSIITYCVDKEESEGM